MLYRIDPARNMARFYALSIEPTLFGELSLTRRWGRIGTHGRQIVELHADAHAAATAMRSWHDAKCRRGYEQLRWPGPGGTFPDISKALAITLPARVRARPAWA